MLRSIQWRIAIPIVLLIIISLGILGYYIVSTVRDTQTANLRFQLETDAKIIAQHTRLILTDNRYQLTDEINTLAESTGARITIITVDGTVLADSIEEASAMENHAQRPEIIDALATGRGESTRYSTTLQQQMMYLAVPIVQQGKTVGLARTALPMKTVEQSINRVAVPVILAIAVTSILAVLAAALIARATSRSIRQLTRAAKQIATGELDQQIMVNARDEIGELAHAFNEMSQSLKKTIAGIEEEGNKLSTVLSTMADGVIMTDDERTVVMANTAAEYLFDFKESNILGQPLIQAVYDYEIDEIAKGCLNLSQEQSTQLELGLSRTFIRAIAVPLRVERFAGVLLLFQDLTQMRNLQTTRREFVGNVSHELRTPLSTIKAIVETLANGAIEDRAKTSDFLAKIDAEVDKLTQMVGELTELSRIETGQIELNREKINLRQLIDEVINRIAPQAERQKIAISNDIPAELPYPQADRERIGQVIQNLLHNAIKFTPPSGNVVISSEYKRHLVVVSVTDNGIGISSEDLPHVFERFYKADKARSGGGTGLGLAIAKHIIQAHGGAIWAQSQQGKGSTFSFNLPIKSPRI